MTRPILPNPDGDWGLHVHGRHLGATEWEKMMSGDPVKQHLGSLPAATATMLDIRPNRIAVVTIGTGASELPNGTKEAQAMHERWVDELPTYADQFKEIGEHPAWQDRAARNAIRHLVEKAVLDLASKNTLGEVEVAARFYGQYPQIRTVTAVTAKDHGARALNEAVNQLDELKDAGVIPRYQHWSVTTDNIAYPDAGGPTFVAEEPHRDDDEERKVSWARRRTALARDILGVPPVESRRAEVAAAILRAQRPLDQE